jgi:hypothetical protein
MFLLFLVLMMAMGYRVQYGTCTKEKRAPRKKNGFPEEISFCSRLEGIFVQIDVEMTFERIEV